MMKQSEVEVGRFDMIHFDVSAVSVRGARNGVSESTQALE